MSALNEALKQQNRLLSAQVEELATKVDNMMSNFSAVIAKLQPHEPEYVKQFLVQDTPVMASAEATAEAMEGGK